MEGELFISYDTVDDIVKDTVPASEAPTSFSDDPCKAVATVSCRVHTGSPRARPRSPPVIYGHRSVLLTGQERARMSRMSSRGT